MKSVLLFIISTFLIYSTTALADPPNRVIRLKYFEGPVSFSPAQKNEWFDAKINRPLMTGDRIWTDEGARASLELNRAQFCLGSLSSLNVLNLTNNSAQFELAQGTLILHILKLNKNQEYEIDTPTLAFIIKDAGDYRINVNNNKFTTIIIHKGQGEVYGEQVGFVIKSNNAYQFTTDDLKNYQIIPIPATDDIDAWCHENSNQSTTALSYVSSDIIGYSDLDRYGSWVYVEHYGYIWAPHVERSWAPYTMGQWVWIDPWGWTWIDEEPWGFAPFHYGRWVHYNNQWYWVPGPRTAEVVYSPALVVFIAASQGFLSNQIGSWIGWLPLGPGDIYIPPYTVSRDYFVTINTSNTRINQDVARYYNNSTANLSYVNEKVPNAIQAISATDLQNNKSISTTSKINADEIVKGKKINHLALTPEDKNLSTTEATSKKPPMNVIDQKIVTKNMPAKKAAPLSTIQPELKKKPGKPIAPETINHLTPPAIENKKIKVVKPIAPSAPLEKPVSDTKPSKKVEPEDNTSFKVDNNGVVEPVVPKPTVLEKKLDKPKPTLEENTQATEQEQAKPTSEEKIDKKKKKKDEEQETTNY